MMSSSQPFFSLNPHQQVNQWLCIALISFMCFWVVLYYLINRTEAFGDAYASSLSVPSLQEVPVRHLP